MNLLVNQKLTGSTGFSLKAFLNCHRASYTMLQRYAENAQHQFPDTIQIVKWIVYNVDCEYSDVRAALSSIRMDDTPNGLRNDFEAAVALILPTDPVPKKRKEKRSVAEIYTTAADENKTGGGNFPRKTNRTQGGKQGGNLNSGVRKY